jgi:hypothetical protein
MIAMYKNDVAQSFLEFFGDVNGGLGSPGHDFEPTLSKESQ